ncbi:MAG: hypothetical protein COW01_04530 [Bdellovibrionales bacterium CG12_big_fil_rev_8_21_14_0_65_38_15]|nr:MAG: hypothetical protein COW79_11850 [Bdellovibrionales bacterium CG22_combo_CG10-13_8_21_14_all_38_13]PIQ56324.1 MAG: hypothetical protein COW01_04530 [Bdellovibrionales bacterium CG12_big_fil_rev_8_21_14_0_65_38_15]PIR29355.1 MAG: hypothetical protein COV38_11465 [Bdellovibrionales bacterium CG11_big_fil_rev_8_21_14_0_20_38_13]
MNYFSDEKEWQWLFRHGIDWETIIPLYYKSFPTEDGLNSKEEALQFFKELMASTGEWCGTSVQDRAAKLDDEGAGQVVDGKTIPSPALAELYQEAKDLQLYGISLPTKHGGMGVPASLHMVVLGQLSRACVASSTQLAFFTSIGEMIHRFCDDETADRLVPKIVAGELSGSMCLTEPGCGSDLGLIRTTAAPQPDGSYHINGSKIFITNGGGGIHFTLARVNGAPEGLDGISMFLLEQDLGEGKNNFNVVKNEEKMGMHGSFTTEILYENSKAHIIGKEGEGFKMMLHLMNEARIAVGMQSLGVIEASIGYAVNYANERQQFGKPISELPLMKRLLNDFTTERDAIRALMVDTISHFDIFQKLDLKQRHTGDLTKEEQNLLEEARLWTRKRTPLVKYYVCETGVTLSQRAIQVLGGYGFMHEYPVERYHRDSFGPLLYEGTSQIQALMALKDVVKYAIKDPKRFFQNVLFKHPGADLLSGSEEWSKDFKSIHYRFKKKMLGLLITSLKPEGSKVFNAKSWQSEAGVDKLMVHAETLTQALSYMETLRVLCEHSNKDKARADLFFRYKKLITPRLEGIYADWN